MHPRVARSDLGATVGLSGGYPKATTTHFSANCRVHKRVPIL